MKPNSQIVNWSFLAILVLYVSLLSAAQARDYGGEAERILEKSELAGGLIVQIGCGSGELAAALAANDKYLVHALDTDASRIDKARSHIRSLGKYGRVSADRFDGQRLPYAENLVNLVVSENLGALDKDEVMRVLCPNGVAYIKSDGRWAKTVKSWPANIDEWTHYLHGPDGNPVAKDTVVGPPKHYQWLSGPLWLRSHESDSSVKALVTAKGRIFYIVDEAPTSLLGPHRLPDKWFLAARDAFNGIELWRVPIKNWGWQAWKPSWFTPRPGGIPLNLPKCLVAVEDEVYVTLGYRAAVSQLDARTGKILQTYKGTDGTAEILHLDDSLVLTLITDEGAKAAKLDTETGRIGWKSEKDYGGTTTDYYRFRAAHGSVPAAKVDPTLNIATDGKIVSLLDRDSVVALDYETGKELWRTKFPLVQADHKAGNINAGQTLWTGTLIVKDGVVLHASPSQLAAFDATGGQILWSQPKKYLQHLWFEWKDVFVIDGLAWTWSAELRREKLEGGKSTSAWPATANGYDLHTGKLIKQVPLGKVFKTHHHHRCYRNKATVNYILASRRGTEYIDLKNAQHTVHNWVRGTCHLGMMPANGLQYAPPHPCVCYIEEKLNGFNALAPEIASPDARNVPPSYPLEKGSAFKASAGPAATAEDWPTFRADPSRSGSVATKVPSKPELLWKQPTDGKLAAPIVVGETLFIPQPDAHNLLAVNASDGRVKWQFTAGSRVDSPPTYTRGRLLFGSADGWVYCIGAETGRLIWRFRAAPRERLISAFGRLESAWPVHGAVLVYEDTAYFAAGRSSQLDGGIYLFGLDPDTAKERCRARLEGPHYSVNNIEQNYLLPMGTLPGILQAVDGTIYMRQTILDKYLRRLKRKGTAGVIHAKAGMLDDAYFKRTPWTLGSTDASYGRLLVHDVEAAYSIRMFDSLRGLDPNVYFTPADKGYLLFATDKSTGKRIWERRIPIRVNAMVSTTNVLFVAGYPDKVDPADPLASFEGRAGGILMACDKATGEELSQYKLSAPPVFNGMAAANGRLYVAMQDVRIAAFGE
ncbi:MAG: outer membrane protein assembly factor BamB family protein [Planctomycetota bacterium]|jgi:outer membrane protein assembly factor BamB/ubiquinone/menaquinone biosynthesis C-methylase UbiE